MPDLQPKVTLVPVHLHVDLNHVCRLHSHHAKSLLQVT